MSAAARRLMHAPSGSWPASRSSPPHSSRGERRLERETGIEPATNSLEGCDSTTELLPPSCHPLRPSALRRASPNPSRPPTRSALRRHSPSKCALRLARISRSLRALDRVSNAACHERAAQRRVRGLPRARSPFDSLRSLRALASACVATPTPAESSGGEGRIRTFEAAWATDLQSAAFDRFATSPISPASFPLAR